MNHSTNIVWGERGELFLHEKALHAYFCAGVHIILARIVASIKLIKLVCSCSRTSLLDVNDVLNS